MRLRPRPRSTMFNALDGLEKHFNSLPSQAGPMTLTMPGTGRLSPEGHALLPAAAEVVTAFEAFRRTCERVRSGNSYLAIGCFPSYADRVAVAMRTIANEGVALQLVVAESSRAHRGADMVNAVSRHEMDVAVVPDCSLPEGLEAHELYRWQLRCIISSDHQLAGSGVCELSELAGGRILASPRGHMTRSLIDAAGVVQISFETDSADALVALGRTGWGASLVPDDCAPFRNADERSRSLWPIVMHRGQTLSGVFIAVIRRDTAEGGAVRRFVASLGAISVDHNRQGSESSGPRYAAVGETKQRRSTLPKIRRQSPLGEAERANDEGANDDGS